VKQDKHTFFYDEIPLFIAGGNLKEAEKRLAKMGTIQRNNKGKRKAALEISKSKKTSKKK